ncbi:MAG TPA: CoA-binding protein [Candidatus Paceibacterota bacterium]
MAILVDQNTKVLVQGITGTEGSRATREMLSYSTHVIAGVTPGKAGQNVEGVPVYETVSEAIAKHPDINATLVVVPARFALNAVKEAIGAKIPLINVLTEHITTFDSATMYALAQEVGVRIVGPSSVGIISPGIAKLGAIGSSTTSKVFSPGPIGLVSKSGGMTSEIASILTKNSLGQSSVIGIGGDQIIGTDFKDLLELFERDERTKAVVMFGEVGGTYEELVADFIKSGGFTKPVVAVIAGMFTKYLPEGVVLGHAGAIVSRGRGGYDSKVVSLDQVGVKIANSIDEIPEILKKLI